MGSEAHRPSPVTNNVLCTEPDTVSHEYLRFPPKSQLHYPASFTWDKWRPQRVSHLSRATQLSLNRAEVRTRPGNSRSLPAGRTSGSRQLRRAGVVPLLTSEDAAQVQGCAC